jgi:hypothetical protein
MIADLQYYQEYYTKTQSPRKGWHHILSVHRAHNITSVIVSITAQLDQSVSVQVTTHSAIAMAYSWFRTEELNLREAREAVDELVRYIHVS